MNMEILSKETEKLEFQSDQILSMLSLTQETNHVQKIYYDIISFISIFVESLVENNTCYQNVEFRFLPPGYDVWMDFSPEYVRIILQNIVHDAMERCSINNCIEIRAAKNETGKICFIYISDNGRSNIYQNDSEAAIDKYEKRQKRSDSNNSNLKLLLARQLIASQGGNLYLECHSKESTTVKLSLPIAHHAQISNTNELEMKEYFERPLFENMQKHLLFIVVNNPQNIKHLISPLKQNFDLIIVDDENELFKLVVEKKPQCIIFEINASCFENNSILLEKIKESGQASSIPVILLTFETAFSDHFHLLKNKADACLAQPFANEELICLIKKLIYLKTQVTIYKDFSPVNDDVEQIENSEKKYDPQFIEQITNIIYRESGKNEDLIPFLASEMCLSQCQLNRRIKAATELTTSNFILRVRLNKAKKLLTKSQKPIGEIALECGFNDFSYFSRSFKKEFGMTPSAFQRLPHHST
jgi:AraC-like DNA-binding protein